MVGTGSRGDLYEVSDSTDWLATPFASLAPIDASLRCQVCKDFYKTPMITSCSHTFCSLCIRRCLANDGKCPACRTEEQENRLRSNWAIEGLVDDFIRARPALLDHARDRPSISRPLSPKRKLDETGLDDQQMNEPRKKTRFSSRLSARDRSNVVTLDAEGDDDDEYQPEDGLVTCPVCGIRMKVETINSHVDRCLIDSSHDNLTKPIPIFSPVSHQTGPNSVQPPPKRLDRLPQLNYSLFKDVALRKKLQELGISTQGSRQLLERRHAEWVTLWNANCDASKPRKKIELLHELEVWERTQGARVPSLNGGVNSGSQILHKDFDSAGWAAKNNLSFQNLIASARKTLANAGPITQPDGPIDSVGCNEGKSKGALATPAITLLNNTTTTTVMNDQSPSFHHSSTNKSNLKPTEPDLHSCDKG